MEVIEIIKAIKVRPKNIQGDVLYLLSKYLPTYKAMIIGKATKAETLVNMIIPGFHQDDLLFLSSIIIKNKATKPIIL